MRGQLALPLLLILRAAASYQLPVSVARPLRAPSPACQLVSDSPPALSLNAPAKINLFLRILRKRTDGFHELSSLFQTVSLMDRLDFWQLPEDDAKPLCSMEVTPDSLGAELIPTDESNLVMRALQLFAERTGEKRRVHCRLHKAVPAQGGLGGGSCDAATALHAANRLAGFPVSESELIEWGGELGSDVSFFLSRGTAMCTGRGELIEPLPPLPPCSVWLVKPAVRRRRRRRRRIAPKPKPRPPVELIRPIGVCHCRLYHHRHCHHCHPLLTRPALPSPGTGGPVDAGRIQGARPQAGRGARRPRP